MKNRKILFVLVFALSACGEAESPTNARDVPTQRAPQLSDETTLKPAFNPNKNAYFGDLHVHTENSFDAYTFGTIATPHDAYKYAQGEAILHPTGYQIQLSRPLDFYAVTDHAMFLGLLKEAADTTSEFSRYDFTKPLHGLNDSVSNNMFSVFSRSGLFRPFARQVNDGLQKGEIDKSLVENVGRSVWQKTIKAADDAYKPGTFTTFAGYEYSSSVDLYEKYLHRNVIFRDTKNLPERLFSRIDSQDPEKLWAWMDGLREKGVESLAIPHNSNISGGAAFPLTDYDGAPIGDEYAKRRILNEPLVEITQVKGTSETHPLLSKNDEWAGFEVTTGHKGEQLRSNLDGSYVRDAYLRGLSFSAQVITNPYKFGVIGSSDTHVGGGSDNEEVYFSKVGLLDGTAELRGSIPFNKVYGTVLSLAKPEFLAEGDENKRYFAANPRLIHFSASGLAAVWAEENTREAIYDALRRKETFATSGPRIKIRFFAGYDLAAADLNDAGLLERLYANGVPMGATISLQQGKTLSFFVWATADPLGAPLQRLQIIKGWLEDGEKKEKVYDVACSDGLSVDPETSRCPDNGAFVDLKDCSISANSGDKEIKTVWQDPEFLPNQEAFYYLRVLENPVCRWSTWDAVRVAETPRSDMPATIQERAWSSPIWFN